MPSGPPELHEKYCNLGPHEGIGDANAITFLESKGYVLSGDWFWSHPEKKNYDLMSEEEYEALCYLCWEWDFGGLRPSLQ